MTGIVVLSEARKEYNIYGKDCHCQSGISPQHFTVQFLREHGLVFNKRKRHNLVSSLCRSVIGSPPPQAGAVWSFLNILSE